MDMHVVCLCVDVRVCDECLHDWGIGVDCEAALRGRVMASGGRLLLFFYRRPAAEAAGGGVASECAWGGSGCRPCLLAGWRARGAVVHASWAA